MSIYLNSLNEKLEMSDENINAIVEDLGGIYNISESISDISIEE